MGEGFGSDPRFRDRVRPLNQNPPDDERRDVTEPPIPQLDHESDPHNSCDPDGQKLSRRREQAGYYRDDHREASEESPSLLIGFARRVGTLWREEEESDPSQHQRDGGTR